MCSVQLKHMVSGGRISGKSTVGHAPCTPRFSGEQWRSIEGFEAWMTMLSQASWIVGDDEWTKGAIGKLTGLGTGTRREGLE